VLVTLLAAGCGSGGGSSNGSGGGDRLSRSDYAAKADAWLAQSEVLKHDLQEMRDKAKAKDLKGVQEAFARASANDKQGNRLAAKLGMKVCSKG
jgi:hypothetical protein